MRSRYDSTENLKITYFLGAGASYNSIPIWKSQGQSMIAVAESILRLLKENMSIKKNFPKLADNDLLINFFTNLKHFGNLAIDYGSIDIYARRLYLINDKNELNELKKCLSVYFDLWENFLHKENTLRKGENIFESNINFEKIDKRYLALLSVLLEKDDSLFPKLNSNVSFLTWNYDLQLETAFESFLPRKSSSLVDTNSYLNFMNLGNEPNRKEVLHLNGFRGYFSEGKEIYDTVERKNCFTIESYLESFLEIYTLFRNPDYTNSIKYAWEANSESLENARNILSDTNILIIVGYSFPAFNRRIDSELIKIFEKKQGYKKIIYQDPYANNDIIESIFSNPAEVIVMKDDVNQFHIPHEFLFPSAGEEFLL